MSDYTPDGWLGFMLAKKLYVNFSPNKHPFELAMSELRSKLELLNIKPKGTTVDSNSVLHPRRLEIGVPFCKVEALQDHETKSNSSYILQNYIPPSMNQPNWHASQYRHQPGYYHMQSHVVASYSIPNTNAISRIPNASQYWDSKFNMEVPNQSISKPQARFQNEPIQPMQLMPKHGNPSQATLSELKKQLIDSHKQYFTTALKTNYAEVLTKLEIGHGKSNIILLHFIQATSIFVYRNCNKSH
jgi:hypothetical protein